MSQIITESLSPDDIQFFFSGKDIKNSQKVISYITRVPLSEILDINIYYDSVVNCLQNNGLCGNYLYHPVFNTYLIKARENFSIAS